MPMKAYLPPISSYQQAPAQRHNVAGLPRFGGVGDMASSLVGVIDSKRAIELVFSDAIGMILPRVLLALLFRGPDDGRETGVREGTGLIGNIFLAGWVGYGVTRMLGDSVNAYNPKGIPGRAWINAQNLDAFGQIYLDELKKASGSEQARENFVYKVLGGLQSADHEFSIESRLSCLEQLSPDAQGQMLEKMRKAVPHPDKINLDEGKDNLKKLASLREKSRNPADKALYTEAKERIRRQFFDAGWGKLSEQAKADLAKHFAQKPTSEADSKILGTLPLDKITEARVKQKERDLITEHGLESLVEDPKKLKTVLRHKGFDRQKEFIKQRLALSLSDLKYNAKEFQEAIDKKALHSNLTSTVKLEHQLRGDGRKIQLTSNRGTLLQEMKYFLEQYADRAVHEAKQDLHQDIEKWDGEIKKRIEDKLTGVSPKKTLLRKLIPQSDDGLITAAIKSRGAYTWLPIGICLAAAGAFTFYNNYLTMKKHSGKVFFPGEGMPPPENVPKFPMKTGQQNSVSAANATYCNFGRFPNHPQFSNHQGGIIA
jgi:hypothetical protein